jgi:O-antigen polymerase
MSANLKYIFSVLLPAIIISLLFVTPFMVSDEIYNDVIMAKEFWFFGVVALMLFYTAIQLIIKNEGNENNEGIKNEKLRINLNLIDILLIAFYTWCFIRAIFTPYTPFYYNHKLQVLTGMMVVYFFVKNTLNNEKIKNEGIQNEGTSSAFPIFNYSFLILNLFILSGFLQAIYGLLQLYGVYPSHHSLFKVTGSFFNPAPYAMYLAVVFPVALGQTLIKNEKIKNEGIENEKLKLEEIESTGKGFQFLILNSSFSIKRFFSFFILNPSFFIYCLSFATVVAILLILPATMNRASWLGAAAGSLVVLQYKYNWLGKIKGWLNNRTKKLLAITGSIILIGGICISLFYLKAGSSNGRLFIWKVTLGKIAEKPMCGHGLARFEAEYNNWQAEYFKKNLKETDSIKYADNTRYAFNEYLEIWTEVGMVGLLLFISLIISAFIGDIRKTNNFFILVSFLSLLLIATISFPFYSLPTFFVFFVLLALLSSFKKAEIKKNMLITSIGRTMLFFIFISASAFLFRKVKLKYMAYNTWNMADNYYNIQNYEKASDQFASINFPLQYTGIYWQHYGKALNLNEEYSKSLEMLNRALPLTSDEVLYTTIGDSYKGLKKYSEAEKAYIHASFIVPYKLYPRYLLVKLYSQCGDSIKVKQMATNILLMQSKVSNRAEEEIKEEMKKYIQ